MIFTTAKIERRRFGSSLSGLGQLNVVQQICGGKPGHYVECMPGTQRLDILLRAFQKDVNNFKAKLNKTDANFRYTYRSGKEIYLKAAAAIYGITDRPKALKIMQDTIKANLRPNETYKILGGYNFIYDEALSYQGLQERGLYLYHTSKIERSYNYEEVIPLKIMDSGRFTKYPASNALVLIGNTAAFKQSGSAFMQEAKSAVCFARDAEDVAIFIIQSDEGSEGAFGANYTAYKLSFDFPYIVIKEPLTGGDTKDSTPPADDTTPPTDGKNPPLETDPCPCRDVVTNKTLYLRKTKAADSDIPVDILTSKQICKQSSTQKRYKFKCDEDELKRLNDKKSKTAPQQQNQSFPNYLGRLR